MSQAGGAFALGGTTTSTLPPGATVNDKGQIISADGEVIGTVAGGTTVGSTDSGSTDEVAAGTTYTKGGNEFGPGVTDTHIMIGLVRISDQRSSCEAIGTCGFQANQPSMDDDYVDWYNKNGGIAGRKIKLVKYEISSAEALQPDASQKACTYFTQDHPVFAFIGVGSPNENRCANNAGVSMISTQRVALSSESFYANPYVYLVGGATLTNGGVMQGRGLLESGYFDEPSPPMAQLPRKVGVLAYDNADHISAVEEGLKKTLAAGGVTVDREEYIYAAKGDQEFLTRSEAEIQNAVLQFKTENITHVMFLTADGGALPAFFIKHAQDQNYFPRYGFTTGGGFATIVDEQPIGIELRNFIGAVQSGWYPINEISEGQKFPNPPRWPECKAIGESYGYPATTTNERVVLATRCDVYEFLKRGIEAGLPDITAVSFKAGAESLGRSFQGSAAYASFFGPGSHDDAAAYQVALYYESCECVRPWLPVKRFK